MKNLFLKILVLILVAGCNSSSSSSKSDDVYEMKNLPSNFIIAPPKSLSGSGSANRTNLSSQAMSYDLARAVASVVPALVSKILFNAILLDDLSSAGLVDEGVCYERGEVSITYKKSIVNLFKEIYEDAFGEEINSFDSLAGVTEENSSAFVWKESPISKYDGMLKVGFNSNVCSSNDFNTASQLMQWSDAGLQYTFDFAETAGGTLHGGFGFDKASNTMSVAFRTDSSLDETILNESMMSGTYSSCGDDCVNFLTFYSSSNFILDMKGRADDKGGYGVSRFFDGNSFFWVEEYWDSSSVKYQKFSQCDATFDNYTNCLFTDAISSDNTGLTSYSNNFGKVFGGDVRTSITPNQSFTSASAGTVYVYMSDNSSLLSEYIVGAGVKIDNSSLSSTFFSSPKNGDVYYLRELFTQSNYGMFDVNTAGEILVRF